MPPPESNCHRRHLTSPRTSLRGPKTRAEIEKKILSGAARPADRRQQSGKD